MSFLENAMRIANKRYYTAVCYCFQHFPVLLLLTLDIRSLKVQDIKLSACLIAETIEADLV